MDTDALTGAAVGLMGVALTAHVASKVIGKSFKMKKQKGSYKRKPKKSIIW